MSKSFKIVNGDLSVTPGRSYDVVSGVDKLKQDLSLWILERIGIDSMTPTYGSRLDGGIIDGTQVDSFIGAVATADSRNRIRIEVTDLLSRYQQMQYEKIREETLLYQGNNTLDGQEVLDQIESVEVTQAGDIILVRVIVSTLAGTNLKITIPLSA